MYSMCGMHSDEKDKNLHGRKQHAQWLRRTGSLRCASQIRKVDTTLGCRTDVGVCRKGATVSAMVLIQALKFSVLLRACAFAGDMLP